MRLIDADVLKQHIDKLPALPDGNFAGNHSALKALINMQPTIESSTNCSEIPNNWIPCSERLPEEDHWLGGSGKQFSDNVLVTIVNRDDEDAWVDVSHTIDGKWALELPRHCKILAWMPLPSPYQPGEESE